MWNTARIKDPQKTGLAHRIAFNFRRLRKTRGWTQAQAAGKLGVNRSYLSRIETANAPLGKNAQIKWARIFGVDIGEFFKLPSDEKVQWSGQSITKRIAFNFKRLRDSKGWTQEEAAAKAGIDRSYPGSIESCCAGFGKRAQQRWAKVFGVDVSEFYKPLYAEEPKPTTMDGIWPIPGKGASPATIEDIMSGILAELRAISGKLDRLLEPSRITIPRGNI